MRILTTSLLAIAFTGAAHAQPALQDENVLMPVPDGFRPGAQTADGPMSNVDFFPEGEHKDAWTQKISQNVYRSPPPPTLAVNRLATTYSERYGARCGGENTTPVAEGEVNGYAYGVWRLVCAKHKDTGKPEYQYVKLIRGADALYIIQYTFRGEPTDERNAAAEAFLAKVSACDTRKPEHPCPDLKPAAQ